MEIAQSIERYLQADPFGFSLDTIDEILLNGVRYSFMPPEQKQKMEADFRAEMKQLRQDLHL